MKRGEIRSIKADRVGKVRPHLIVSSNKLNGGYDVTVVPFNGSDFGRKKDLPFCVAFLSGEFGLAKDCVAKCDEIARIRKSDLNPDVLGTVPEERLADVIAAINWCLTES